MADLHTGSSDYDVDTKDTQGETETTALKTDAPLNNGQSNAIIAIQNKLGVALDGSKFDLATRLLVAIDAAGLLKLADVIQFQYATIATVSASLSTTIPYDATIPEKTEGTEVLTKAFTPKSATSILEIVGTVHLSADAADEIIVALFQDAVTNALGASVDYASAAEKIITVTLRHLVVSGSTSARTYKLHAGGGSQPLVMNGITPATPAIILGGALVSSLRITEWQV